MEIPLLYSSKIHCVEKKIKTNEGVEMEKKKPSNCLLIFHGTTIYGAVSTSNLLLSYTRAQSMKKQQR